MQKPFHWKAFHSPFVVQPHLFLDNRSCLKRKSELEQEMSEKKEEQTVSIEMTNVKEHTPVDTLEDEPYVKGDM